MIITVFKGLPLATVPCSPSLDVDNHFDTAAESAVDYLAFNHTSFEELNSNIRLPKGLFNRSALQAVNCGVTLTSSTNYSLGVLPIIALLTSEPQLLSEEQIVTATASLSAFLERLQNEVCTVIVFEVFALWLEKQCLFINYTLNVEKLNYLQVYVYVFGH